MKKFRQRHSIRNAYEAYWFLHEHPKFQRKERGPLEPDEVEEAKKPAKKPKDGDVIGKIMGRRKGFRIVKDKGGNFWREWSITVPALVENLNIHYTAVDEHRRVSDDASKNQFSEVWLEFGQVLWGHHADGATWRGTERAYKMHYHDVDLDCGAPTFDEALVKLAKKVKKKYGDFISEPWHFLNSIRNSKEK
jgi:hypothetical protein